MTPQALKASILQLAIQGKLVPQRPEEGTAEDLYQQIQAEKQRLIAEGTIKKEKSLPPIEESEIPFEIPETWKWVRWGEIVNVVSARRVHQSDWKSNGIPFYRAREIAALAEKGSIRNELYISEELYQKFLDSGVPHQGDVMVTAVGTLGKAYIVKDSDRFYYKDASVICLENIGNIEPKYIKHVLDSEMMKAQIKANSSGTTVGTLTIVRMNTYLLSFPPLAEQKRIVAKIEEMLPLIDRYGEAYEQLQAFNKRFPDDLRKSILQEAIQGKLVPQLPEEGTAEDLYQQIQAEKKRLIAEGTIKKEKPLPPIEEKDTPFDIPETWKWVRLGDVCRMDLGKTPPRAETEWWDGGTIPWVSIADMQEGGHISTTKESVCEKAISSVFNAKISKAGTLLMSFKLTIGRVSILNMDAVHNEAIVSIYPHYDHEEMFKNYLFSILPLISKEGNFKNAIKGKTLNKSSLNNILLPLAPLAEQKRIVVKIDEMLTLCKELN